MESNKELSQLLDQWKSERAVRVNFSLSRFGLFFSIIIGIIDFSFKVPLYVLSGDFVLFFGSVLTFHYSKDRIYRPWAWVPVYLAVWFAVSTSLLDTGGHNSPFLGGYMALLFVSALVIQTRIRIFFLMIFILLNLGAWVGIEYFIQLPPLHAPPLLFIFAINGIVLAGLGVCIYAFLRTEKDLAVEVLRHYKELSLAQENLTREEAANATKTTFLANISHELRTPLGAILGYADLALDEYTSEAERIDFIGTIKSNGHKLLQLVNDLLDLTKVEAGKVEIERIQFNPMESIEEVISLLSLTAVKKGLKLKLKIEKSVPGSFFSDPLRFRQILMNVISNAIKFSDHGSIIIIVNFPYIDEQSQDSFLIEVQDSGPGLTEEEKKRLFKPFSQADASVSRKFGGSGLGLNLSKHLARLLGGDLYLAWTQPGVGSRFAFRLPLEVQTVAEKPKPAEVVLDSIPDFKGLRILIVEDNQDNQLLISKYIQATGVEISLASDGLEGVKKATDEVYDLILMDVQMPIMDGLQAVILLRQKRFTKPILALTAHAMKEDRERCLAAGFDDYLTKPMNRQLLISKLQQHLNKKL